MNFRLVFLLLIACTLGGCGGKKPEPQAVVAEFFQQCATGQTAQAYASTADLFQLTRSQVYFEARIREMLLDQAKATWSAPETIGETVRVKGVFTRSKGAPLTLLTKLKKEGGRWKVLDVREERAGARGGGDDIFEVDSHAKDLAQQKITSIVEATAVAMPNDHQLQQMVDKVIVDFNTALRTGDFTDFFNSTAERWRFRGKPPEVLANPGNDPERRAESDPDNRDERLTMTNIRVAFKDFLAQKVDLSTLLGKPIIFETKPVISSEGVLSLEGHYADYLFSGAQNGGVAEPFVVSFRVEFFYEHSAWKLFGFHPHIYKAKAGTTAPAVP
jgi:hypothetical protein